MDRRLERWGPLAGIGWPVAIFATLTYGGLASSAFEWPADPFSVVGTTGDVTAAVFNGGLVVGGTLALLFAAFLWQRYSRGVAVLAGVVGVSFAGAGLFPAGQVLHAVFGTAVMVGCWLWLWAAGVVDWRAGDRGAAVAALLLGAVALSVWLPYDLGVERAQFGYAVAELATFGSAGLWSVRTGVRTWRDPGGSDGPDGSPGPGRPESHS